MKKYILATLSALSLIPFNSVHASTFKDHVKLWKVLDQIGVTTVVNNPIHCYDSEPQLDGIYFPYSGLLVVCQDNRKPGEGEVEWTENDLDTFRHEAQHVIQDCNAGPLFDGKSLPMFDEKELIKFIEASSWTKQKVSDLLDRLKRLGLTDKEIHMEIEAHVVASGISPDAIAYKLLEFCKN